MPRGAGGPGTQSSEPTAPRRRADGLQRPPGRWLFTRWAVVGVVGGLVVAAIVVWFVGLVGVAQFGEDVCISDPPAEAAGWHIDTSRLPPRVTCVYDTVDGRTLEVDHPVYAVAAALWLVGFPVVAVVGIGAVTVVMLRGRARSSSAAHRTGRDPHLTDGRSGP